MSDTKNLIEGKTGLWEVVIGLEVHAQVITEAKLFSGAPTAFGADANSQVSFVDAAFPGMLPVINRHAVEQAIKTGLGINATVNPVSVFDRKNYFYADLPQGYQISQFTRPIVSDGHLLIDLPDGTSRRIGITRLHLEQDAGKSLHDQDPKLSYIDLNRAGIALMEIVSEPDLRSSEEAAAYLKKLRSILRYLETCDGNMEEGSMRCDANVSVRRPGAPFGTRCEIKNVNSIRFVAAAIDYEARRQIEILEDGGSIAQETRLYDSAKGVTRSMRSKEEAHDYRYFPDPDLLPLELDAAWIDRVKAAMPELPDARRERYMRDFGLSAYDSGVLVSEKETAAYFEAVARGRDAKMAANWVTVELFGALNKTGRTIEEPPVSAEALGGLIDLIADNTISTKIAKDVFQIMVETGKSAAAIVEEQGLRQVTDTGAIEAEIDKVLAANADKVAEYRSGKDKLFGFFVGQVMKATGGKANPGMLNDLLKQKLAGSGASAMPQSASRFAAVIFDMDGLLLDTERVFKIVWQSAAAELGLSLTDAVFLDCVGRNNRDSRAVLHAHLGAGFDYDRFLATVRLHYAEYRRHTPIAVKAGVGELLDHLDRHGIPRAVATSTGRKVAEEKLTATGLLHRFHGMVCGDEVAEGKPAPEPYLKAAALLGVAPNTCLGLEDSENGIRSAVAAGLHAVMIPDLKAPSEEIRALAHGVMPSLLHVRDWLLSTALDAEPAR